MARNLTPRQAAFVREYLLDLNATQAAIRAGYSPKAARVTGPETLSKPAVATAIERAMAKRAERTEVTAERVLAELAKLAFANLGDYFNLTGNGDPFIDLTAATRDQLAALTEIQVDDFTDGRGEDARDVKRVRVKMADKKAALELLGKHLGMFTERVDHTTKGEALQTPAVFVYLPDNQRDK